MKRLLTTLSLAVLASTMPAAESMSPKATPDPDMAGVLSELAQLKPKPIDTLSAAEARKQPTPADAVKAYLKKKDMKASPEKVADVDDQSIEGPGGKIKIRVYTPEGKGPFPVIVYYHGGGFVIADLDTYDSTPRALANAASAVVVSSHYRQAPEHKFPASHEDAFTTYQWVLKNAAKIKGDPQRVAVAGESAGGNLAAAVSLMARDRNIAMPVHQLLVCPITDNDMTTPSYQENADAKPLNKAMMAWFFKNEANAADATDPRLALLKKADVKGFPSTTIVTAQIDPLRSEGEAFAQKLKAAGVPVNHRNFDGVTHEFFGMAAAVGKAKEAVTFAATDLKQAFSRSASSRATE